MKAIKNCRPEDLNQQTRDYLRKIWRGRGANHPGVFIRGRELRWSVLGCLAGLLLLGAAWNGLRPESLYRSLAMQSGVAAVGMVLLASSLQTLCLRFGQRYLGNFAYFDGTWYWEVEPHRVAVTDLTQVVDLQAMDDCKNGVRTKTVAHIVLPWGEWRSITFADQSTGRRFVEFLQVCQGVRRQAALGQLSPSVRKFVSDPAGLAQAARVVLDSGGMHMSLDRGKLIPIPDATALRAGQSGGRRLAWQVGIGSAVFAAGCFGFPPLRYAIDHDHHYELVKSSAPTDAGRARAYLTKFPAGRYREEVTEILDDRLFAIASRSATQQHSPAAMRNYLASQPNHRHAEDARSIIGRFYDGAIARVQELAARQPTDTNLLSGLLAILEHLKAQPTPRVTVAFQSSVTVEPTNDLVEEEHQHQALYAKNDAVIERMVQTTGSAVIGTYDTFSGNQVRRRESLILSRLSEAVAKILSSDLIVFEESALKQTGNITIHYEIKPRGRLTKYVRPPMARAANFATQMAESLHPETALHLPNTTNTLGLLREYTIDWRLTIRSGAEGVSYTYRLSSNAGTNLVYRTTPGDPEWGAYAVLMYSAFYDFSNRMLAGVGLTPPPAPTTFTFQEAINR